MHSLHGVIAPLLLKLSSTFVISNYTEKVI
jgi:hypothetical protein